MSGNNNTITAADAIITLTVNNLYPSGVQLQGFAADNVYGTDPLVLAETVRGIDGKLSAGFVYSNIITAADAIITLTVNNLYPSGVQLQGFAADNVYGT
ncbi:hypothetical protein V5H41_22315, partial [Salmonella enterica]